MADAKQEPLAMQRIQDELREVFQLFDFDDSGSIDASEIQKVLNNLGYHFQLADCKRIVAAVDLDGNGEVDLGEFVTLMTQKAVDHVGTPVGRQRELQDAFRVFDVDGNGSISADEILSVMQKLGIQVDEEVVRYMIEEVDDDGNGAIEIEEFVALMDQGPPSKK
eukprot:GABV01002734.1.p1 GENE.GABV01002734.1~~GABV01002734.1.p1  ORF type:complete len:165 (+),score=51.19 GABV01002734.1:92-586(+)